MPKIDSPEELQLIKIPEFLSGSNVSITPLADCDPMGEWCGIHQTPCSTTCELACQSCQSTCQNYCQSCEFIQCGACQSTNQGPTYIAASFTVGSITSNSVNINVSLGSGYTSFRIYCRRTDTSEVVKDDTVTMYSNFTYQISNLQPKTKYTVNVCSIPPSGQGGVWAGAEDFTTSAIAVTPWSWYASNGSASASQTTAMYNAIYGTRQLDGLSYLVWNDLCDKVNETAIAAGSSWVTNWGTLSATRMTSSNKALTAQRFNALKNNVGSRVSTGIQDVGVNSPIYWEYFLTIASKLNVWIASI